MKKLQSASRIGLTFILAFVLQTCIENPGETGWSGHPFSAEERDILAHQNRRTVSRVIPNYIQSPSIEIRFRLSMAIANSRDTLQVFHLEKLLNDSSPLVRSGAAFALGQLPCNLSRVFLVNHLSLEEDREVQRQIAIALGQIVSARNIDAILNPANIKADEWLCESLVYAFQRQIYSLETIRFLISHVQSGTPVEQRLAVFALSRLRDRNLLRESTDELQIALTASEAETRLKIIACLAPQHFSGKAELWQKLITDESPRIRIEAARGIGSLANNHYILNCVLSDSNAMVVATALENLPDSLALNYNVARKLRSLERNSSSSVRRALVKYLTGSYRIAILPDFNLWPLQDDLWPDVVAGLSEWGQPAALAILDSLAQHPYKFISTPAYSAMIELAGQLYSRSALSDEEFATFITNGLQSNDPVQIALAAEAMQVSSVSDHIPKALLYTPLKKFKNAEFSDAVIEILKTIAILRPADGANYIEPLLTARDGRIRDLARQTATKLYQLETRQMPDDYYGAGKRSNLSKLAKYGLRPKILLETERGNITIRLDGYYAPFTVDAFLSAVEKGFYNGLTFHRVVSNFVVQGGDPRGDGWGGPGYTLLTERSPLGYSAGSVGMARSDFDTEGSQFFITLTDQPHLNFKYTRFGEVIAGLEIAARIEKGDRILAISVLE